MEKSIFDWRTCQDIVGNNKHGRVTEYLVRTKKGGGPLGKDERITYCIVMGRNVEDVPEIRCEIKNVYNVTGVGKGWYYPEQFSVYRSFCKKMDSK